MNESDNNRKISKWPSVDRFDADDDSSAVPVGFGPEPGNTGRFRIINNATHRDDQDFPQPMDTPVFSRTVTPKMSEEYMSLLITLAFPSE